MTITDRPLAVAGWRAALVLAAASLAAPLAAQHPVEIGSAREAIAIAGARHPTIAAIGARGRAEAAVVRQEAALPNPVVEWRRENLRSPIEPDAFLTVSQPLGVTGRRLALRAEARALSARALADSATSVRAIEADAARAFWRASLARALADLAASQRADAARLADYEGERAREGAVAELVAMRAHVESERARLAEATARAEEVRARAELARALGLGDGALPSVSAALGDPLPDAPPPTAESALALALARRGELAALRAGVEAARRRVAAERRGALPELVLQAGTKRTAGYTTSTMGVALPLPVLDRNGGSRERASAMLQVAESELRAGEQRIRVEVLAAIEALSTLLVARAPDSESLAARAAETAAVTDTAYAAGGASLLELLDARRARAETLATALRWGVEVRLARLDLNRAVGAPLLESLETP